MGHKQGPTTIFVDNNTASRICNSTIKRQRSRSMKGQYFWLLDQVNLNTYRIIQAPGLENLADYFTKHFAAAHHRTVRLFYVHMHNSPRVIRKVDRTVSARLRGCVDVPAKPVARARLWSGRRPSGTSDGIIAESALHVTRATNVLTDRLNTYSH